MNSQSLSVLVVERHAMLRDALCAAIASEPDLAVAGQVADSVEAIQAVGALQPEIILLAMENPLLDLPVIHALRGLLPGTLILVLTNNEMMGEEQAALENGAHAVLSKTATCCELIYALRALRQISGQGNPQLSPRRLEGNSPELHSR